MEDEYEKKRALDEIPQSAAGKTIMTTEPKFVPNNTASIKIDDIKCNIKLIDCVGYMINNAIHELEHEEFGNTIRGYKYDGIDYWTVVRTSNLSILGNFKYKLIDISEDALDLNLLIFDMLMYAGGILIY